MSKLKWQDASNMLMIFVCKLNAKEMLENISISTCIEWWAKTFTQKTAAPIRQVSSKPGGCKKYFMTIPFCDPSGIFERLAVNLTS